MRALCATAVFFAGILAFTETAFGAGVRISWSANTEGDLGGYKVYYGTASRQYLSVRNVGTSTTVEISSLGEGRTYYFAVTAYDTSGNESGYSQEVSAAIPSQAVTPDPDNSDKSSDGQVVDDADDVDPGIEPLADSDMDGIPDNVELIWGLNPSEPYDSLLDDDADGVVNLVEYMAGTDPLDPASRPQTDDILKDVICEIGETIDMTWLNHDGELTFEPLLVTMPRIDDGSFSADEPGAYLYNVLDSAGTLVYRLRVSVSAQLCAEGTYAPGAPMNLNELLMGITLQMGAMAVCREIPIAIGASVPSTASAVSYATGNSVVFELLPYGLVLAEPATVHVDMDADDAVVQKYNEHTGSWETVSGAALAGGLVTFSTREFGKFRVTGEDNNTAGGGGGGGGCFISAACL